MGLHSRCVFEHGQLCSTYGLGVVHGAGERGIEGSHELLCAFIGHGPQAGQHMAGATCLCQPGQAINWQALFCGARRNRCFTGRKRQQVQSIKAEAGAVQLTQGQQLAITQIETRGLPVARHQAKVAGQMHDLAC